MLNNKQGGYIGIIVLVVSLAIIGLLYAKTYFAPKAPPPPDSFLPMTASGTPASTGFEQARAEVDAAKAVQLKLNNHNAETNAALGE